MPNADCERRGRHFEAGSVHLWPTLIARTTLKTVTTNHGGSEFAGTTEGGGAEGLAPGESVSESHAGPNPKGVAMRCNWTLRTRSELRLIRPEPEAATGCKGAQIATRAVSRPNVRCDALSRVGELSGG
jgi:hypothetical protein